MRTGGTFNVSAESAMAPLQHNQLQHSPWHSPVPYLFGGLAAMLGLIAFALLILACSYWKLSGSLDNREGGESERDLENGDEKSTDQAMKIPPVYEEKIVVIMAGDEKPRYLATPVSSRASSFGDKNNNTNNNNNNNKDEDGDEKLEVKVEQSKEESSDHQEQNQNRVNPRIQDTQEQS